MLEHTRFTPHFLCLQYEKTFWQSDTYTQDRESEI